MRIETSDLQINAAGPTTSFRLTIDGTGEPEQALDLVSHLLTYASGARRGGAAGPLAPRHDRGA